MQNRGSILTRFALSSNFPESETLKAASAAVPKPSDTKNPGQLVRGFCHLKVSGMSAPDLLAWELLPKQFFDTHEVLIVAKGTIDVFELCQNTLIVRV